MKSRRPHQERNRGFQEERSLSIRDRASTILSLTEAEMELVNHIPKYYILELLHKKPSRRKGMLGAKFGERENFSFIRVNLIA